MTPSFALRHYGPSRGSHAHEHVQVLWTLQGALELEVDGRGQRLAAGQGLLIPPGELHDFEAPQGSRCLVLDTADPAWLQCAARPRHAPSVDHLARFLAASLGQGLPVSQELGAQLLAQAWGPGEACAASAGRRAVNWADLRRWTQTRLAAPLTVADLAARAGLAETQFRARCLSATGLTPMQWLRAQRLDRARLLRTAGLPVALVARRVGYDSPSALTAALRRAAGREP
ncbi:AraC-like DNA-binding protein [Pelomonas saccharophila]|uniref:AraC-like DNA-binding protein n=1 Tax=Roseateles saccharophilus TaxID=304 RepID=A0ABU1YRC3_ROSSA|nr:AraC family transcriptional regulator [Roseateles saccharophilus]MDR7271410.1 AraC-like DNA-binding protein [Roseateles saccharophilus]